MATEIEPDFAYRHSIVDELFIKTADDNYVTARWCFTYGLNVDFFWLGVHALEKYLKAALLLNGSSGKDYLEGTKRKKYGHDIRKLYADVQPLAPELLPANLTRPPVIASVDWHDEPTEKFIGRLLFFGQADNRYQLYGYISRREDVFKLDQAVFAVRRLCQPLGTHFLGKKHPGVPDQSRRERMLRDHPASANLHSHLEDTMDGKRGKMLRHVALNWNFPFAPEGFKHTRIRDGTRSVNPVLVRRILDPLESGRPDQEAHSDKLWSWVRGNIQLPGEFLDGYEKERAKKKAAPKVKTKGN
jgi:hypothetical protein